MKKLLAMALALVMVLGITTAAWAEDAKGTTGNPYTLEEFNNLTEIPAGTTDVYLNIGDVSLASGSVVIGNDNIRDKYERNITAEEPYGISYTDKAGINLIIVGGTIKDGPAVDNSVANKIAFRIPDKSIVTFKDVKIEGFFGMSGATSDNPYGTVMPHMIKEVIFDNCTFNALWFQNGGFGTKQITIKDSTFNKHENSVSAGNTNPLWFKNIGQTTKVGDATWELGTNINIDNCKFNTNRPVKVVEETVTGQTISVTNSTFNMESDTENKNAAIMFSVTNNGSTDSGSLGNVTISGNKVTGGVALLTFYKDSKITMADGATFDVANNELGEGVKESVVWKSTEEFAPDFVEITPYTPEQPPRYYYNSTTTTDTKADGPKGSPKTFDAGMGIYALTAVLSVTGMAYVGKKKF